MASEIDPTVFVDNQKVNKAELRDQFTTAKNEITELQLATSTTRRMAFSDNEFDSL